MSIDKYDKIGNVIRFPTDQSSLIPVALEKIIADAGLHDNARVECTIEDLLVILFEAMTKRGFGRYDNEEYYLEIALVSESLRSLLCKMYDLDHPFQKLANKLFEYDAEENTIRLEQANI